MLFTSVRNPPSPALWRGHSRRHSPSTLLLQLGAEEQVSEQEDVTQLAGALHQLHHEAVLQQLPVLWARCGQGQVRVTNVVGEGILGPLCSAGARRPPGNLFGDLHSLYINFLKCSVYLICLLIDAAAGISFVQPIILSPS